jgi:hypothetical protein
MFSPFFFDTVVFIDNSVEHKLKKKLNPLYLHVLHVAHADE